LQDFNGAVIGQAEMAWTKPKIVFLLNEQADSREAFVSQGWKTVSGDDEMPADYFKETK
jgi:hypothetical protein